MTTEKRVLKFHTGRGGRYYNQGHVTFIKFEEIEEGNNFDKYFFDEDEDLYRDGSNNELDYQINEDGTGYINDDGEYDSTHFVLEEDLNEKQIYALIREFDGIYEKEAREIIKEYYPSYLPEEEEED